ncbi:hypothetical protein M409DRAFT_62764 [Zasmidium cellare ATCC 36951]|uniref:Pre-mRNA splicing factor CLF1 n=1 Tax=Zasmidium cellare ATCC 36951 TaxID=1080233 RepID=A0A6A6D403_ZASCE|nr:uncharacterized protein M409DRAFT_62764 [Zasmidium cellare ATCC 36951]KAF2173178.1 hypothetical protein M409DRAFT_62764 [Zasmidium cellare ATCC 36951]
MSVPTPSKAVSGHCAAINDDILYTFDSDAFQSLHIKENATWSEEESGQPVSGPACVKVVPDGDESSSALYVIGGDTDDGEYPGLQRYSFGNKTWETLSPVAADVLQTRTNHSAVYLKDSHSILVYAGSQTNAPSLLSSQTFLIATEPPYNIQSFISYAPPASNPILQPWNSSHAVMVGGQETNTAVWLFSPDNGWKQHSTDLSQPLDPAARAIIVDGTDGSKVLQVYDLNVSPNTAQGIVLLGAGGQPASTGQTVGSESSSSSRKRKRDLTLDNWPSYNDTNAPTSTRTDCSLTRNSDGLVVMAGGNEDNPLAMYDEKDNSWVDAGKFFNRDVQQPLQPSSSATSKPTPTESVPSSSTTAAAGSGSGESSHDRTMRTLGITLGVLCGIAAIFILVLLYLRWRKLQARKKNGGGVEEKDGDGQGDRMSFQDRGASFMKEAGISSSELAPPSAARYNQQNNSHSSLAIIAGKIGNRNIGHGAKDSFESTTHLVKDKNGNVVPTENHEMMDIGDKIAAAKASNLAIPGAALDRETRDGRKRSSGWSKYFATSAPTGPNGLSHLPSAYANNKPNTTSVGSEYSQDRDASSESRIPSSALVPPLDVDFSKTVDGQRLSHVAQGSPAFFDSREDFARRGSSFDVQDGQRGVIVDPARKSQATSIDSFGARSTLSSTLSSQFYNESGHTPWTPMSGDRATSSVYTESVNDGRSRRPSRGKGGAGFFPGAGTNYRPPKIKLSHAAGPSAEWASPKMPAAQPAQDRDSTVTVFPGANYLEERSNNRRESAKPAAQSQQAGAGAHRHSQSQPINTDMSWLNLGLGKSQS